MYTNYYLVGANETQGGGAEATYIFGGSDHIGINIYFIRMPSYT